MTDATQILVAQMARVWLAAVGVAAPAGPTTTPGVGWRQVGLFTPDSLAWNTDPTFEQVRSHQSNYPTRTFQTGDAATVAVDLQQYNGENLIAVYGGGTITAVTGGHKFAPPAIGGRTQVEAMLEIIDGIKTYRRIIPVAESNEGVAQAFSKTAETTLPLRLTVIGSDVGDPWYDLTNDANFSDVVGP